MEQDRRQQTSVHQVCSDDDDGEVLDAPVVREGILRETKVDPETDRVRHTLALWRRSWKFLFRSDARAPMEDVRARRSPADTALTVAMTLWQDMSTTASDVRSNFLE